MLDLGGSVPLTALPVTVCLVCVLYRSTCSDPLEKGYLADQFLISTDSCLLTWKGVGCRLGPLMGHPLQSYMTKYIVNMLIDTTSFSRCLHKIVNGPWTLYCSCITTVAFFHCVCVLIFFVCVDFSVDLQNNCIMHTTNLNS